MFTTIIEVCIGLILVYVLLSLLVTQLNNIVVWFTKLRANTLFVFVRDHLLQGELGTVLEHPLLNLTDENGEVRRTATYIDPQGFALALSNATVERVIRALETSLQGVDRQQVESTGAKLVMELKDPVQTIQHLESLKVSANNLPAGGQKQAILAELNDMIGTLNAYRAIPDIEHDARVALLKREVENVNSYVLRTALSSLLETVENFTDTIERIGAWFNNRVAETSKVYSRRLTQISFILGLIVAIVLNADTIHIARALWDDAELRQEIVAVVDESMPQLEALVNSTEQMEVQLNATEDPNAPAQTTEEEAAQRNEELTTTLDDLQTTLDLLNNSGIPLGWTAENVPRDVPGFLLTVAGWVITAVATSLGAPFWFDILRSASRK